ncbi:DNA/RNA helicase domain-containing protein [Flavobacterium sp. DSR2-3-3]|uniref:DNA/RNA helicase domain-containing protein n=1 Tax=Flavobacterium sp. DSR2-3-3 TaxID=2804632 RepID=UPI003CEA8C8D
MIIYQNTKESFINDVVSNNIENIIHDFFKLKLGQASTTGEINSWKNSMQYMNNVLVDNEIPKDAGVIIEYQIPQTSKRIDFILTGQDEKNKNYAILIELKQWSESEMTDKDAVVTTFVGKRNREVSHPSYQAWSYASLLEGFNEAVYTSNIQLKPCAYLHNYTADNKLDNKFYQEYIDLAPLFFKTDIFKLRDFIKKFVKFGDKDNIMFEIDGGRIRPSKSLADNLSSMLKGNDEFIMIDDQKVVYENALALAKKATSEKKQVLIVQGGPGTGKSVVAINLLVKLTSQKYLAQYVTKNAAPRAVYETKLKGSFKKSEITNFFTGSGSFTSVMPNIFDALIVDEAHRLNAKSGMYKNLGENQIKEIMNATKFSIFFIDENQKVAIHDIGEIDEIKKWADEFNADVTVLELNSQFRCNGSDGYLAWLDYILQIRETANTVLDTEEYDFKVLDNPAELRDLIFEKNKISNKARLVAGYCWKWNSKKDFKANDIVFPEYDFAMKWNLTEDGMKWVIQPESVNEIGCIHTCQGLEVDYIGVIIGEDLIVRDGIVIINPNKRDANDSTVRGYKKMMKSNPIYTQELMSIIVRNTYRTLMTRGMKGCYIYCVDKETNEYFKKLVVQE